MRKYGTETNNFWQILFLILRVFMRSNGRPTLHDTFWRTCPILYNKNNNIPIHSMHFIISTRQKYNTTQEESRNNEQQATTTATTTSASSTSHRPIDHYAGAATSTQDSTCIRISEQLPLAQPSSSLLPSSLGLASLSQMPPPTENRSRSSNSMPARRYTTL